VALIIILAVAALALLAGTARNIILSDKGKKIDALAKAIARAEGFGIPGALPTRANNPGDLMAGDIGFGEIDGKTVFQTAEDGWDALKRQLLLIVNGRSNYYDAFDTFRQFAVTYTGGDSPDSWLAVLKQDLGIGESTRLGDWVNA
jgi:hypothetical protein